MRDRAASLARRLRGRLAEGETVLAGVSLSVPGATAAALGTAGRVADGIPDLPELRLETPKSFKFLPDVYGRLPAIVADAKAAIAGS